MEYAEQVAQLLGQPYEFAALLDGLVDALTEPAQVERAYVFMSALLLWGWGHGYYPRDPDRVAAVLRRIEWRAVPGAEPESQP